MKLLLKGVDVYVAFFALSCHWFDTVSLEC